MNQYSGTSREKYAARRVMLWQIRRDYLRGLREREEVIEASAAPPDGQPRSTVPGDPTARKAVELTRRGLFVDKVNRALKVIPDQYRDDILAAAVYGVPYPDYASPRTYARHMRRFLDHLSSIMEE